jgi:predicted SAM-dependent methyltransferase
MTQGLLSGISSRIHQAAIDIEAKWARSRKGGSIQFTCPVCSFEGHFVTDRALTGWRYAAICPACGSCERHRLQVLSMRELRESIDFSRLSLLHIAPEQALGEEIRPWFMNYTTGDINPVGVDLAIDLTVSTIPDQSYDVVYASHVLEHIPNDDLALENIARMLKPGGFAVLPVPLVGATTVEYPHPVEVEAGHVRAPGYDYYERYKKHFSNVTTYASEDFDERYQVYVYEDRSRYPTKMCPYRTASFGARHRDVFPIAYV